MKDDKPKLELTEGEEAYLTEMRSLTTNEFGERILAGLTVKESIAYIEYQRRWLAERSDPDLNRETHARRRQHMAMDELHERARMRIVMAENELRVEGPTKN